MYLDLEYNIMTLGQSHDTLGLWTTVVWNIDLIKHKSRESLTGKSLRLSVQCDPDLGDMIMALGLCRTLRVLDNKCVKYYPDQT